MKKAIVILLTLMIATVAFAADDPIKEPDNRDYVMDQPSRIVIADELTEASPTFHRWRPASYEDLGLNCDLVMTSDYSADPHYDQHCFNVTTDAPVEFVVTDAGFDTVIYIYCDPFDANDATLNGVFMDDDDGAGLNSAIVVADGVTLTPGNDYWLVVCGYWSAQFGTYSISTSDNVALCGTVATDASTWSNVKGLFN